MMILANQTLNSRFARRITLYWRIVVYAVSSCRLREIWAAGVIILCDVRRGPA